MVDKARHAEARRAYYLRNREKELALMANWRKKNPEKLSKLRRRLQLRRYGITPEEYDVLFVRQDGKCAICQLLTEEKLHVDHRHLDGKVRGLLCGPCNRAAGLLRDDPQRAIRLARYLEQS